MVRFLKFVKYITVVTYTFKLIIMINCTLAVHQIQKYNKWGFLTSSTPPKPSSVDICVNLNSIGLVVCKIQ